MVTKRFIEEFYLPYIANLRPTTRNGYISSIRLYILPAFGQTNLDDVDVLMVEHWLNEIEKPGAAIKAYKTLRQIIRKAIDYDMYAGRDPTAKHIKMPRKTPYRAHILAPEDVNMLLDGFIGHELEPLVICSVTLGLRRGEACALYWSDIDPNHGTVQISKSLQLVNGEIQEFCTKTEKSTRICYLPGFANERLLYLRGEGGITGNPRMNPEEVARRYKAHCTKNHLPHTSLTNLRHTWATMAIESGADISTVADMLGHTDITMAYRHYLKTRRCVYETTQSNVSSLLGRE